MPPQAISYLNTGAKWPLRVVLAHDRGPLGQQRRMAKPRVSLALTDFAESKLIGPFELLLYWLRPGA